MELLATIILIWLAFVSGLAILFFAWRLVLVVALFGLVFVFAQLRHEAESTRHRAEQQAYADHVDIERAIPNLAPLW